MTSVRPMSDRWIYTERDASSAWYGRNYCFDLSFVRSETLRRELREYVWDQYRRRIKKPATLRQEICWMRYYERWLYSREIGSLARITRADAEGFVSFLHVCVSKKTGRPLSILSQKHIYQTICGIYRWYVCRRKEYTRLLLLFPADVYPGARAAQKITPVDSEQVRQAMCVLEHQKNKCLRVGGALILMTGLATGDLLTLRVDALQTNEIGCYVRFYNHKKQRYCALPVSPESAVAWQRLCEQTKTLRAEAPDAYRMRLFLYRDRTGEVKPMNPDLFRYWLRRAQQTSDAPVTCTMLREFLLCDLREQQVPPAVIHELTGCGLFAERRHVV